MEIALKAAKALGDAVAAGIDTDSEQELKKKSEYETPETGRVIVYASCHTVFENIYGGIGAWGTLLGMGGGGSQTVCVHIAGASEELERALDQTFAENADVITFKVIKEKIEEIQDNVDNVSYDQQQSPSVIGMYRISLS